MGICGGKGFRSSCRFVGFVGFWICGVCEGFLWGSLVGDGFV